MLQELQRIDPSFSRPDQLVSIGTGLCTQDRADAEPTVNMRVHPVYQTYQHYMRYNFNGRQQFMNMRDMFKVPVSHAKTDVRDWAHRFDLPIDGPLADLANPAAIDPLGAAAWDYFIQQPALHSLARGIIASTFYFQLRCMPVYEKGRYLCFGRILCRIPVTNPGFASLIHKIGVMSVRFSVQDRTLSSKTSNVDRLGNFSMPVCVHVAKLDELVHTRLRFADAQTYYASASPMSVESLVRLQKLDWPSVRTCTRRSSRKRSLPQSEHSQKRRKR